MIFLFLILILFVGCGNNDKTKETEVIKTDVKSSSFSASIKCKEINNDIKNEEYIYEEVSLIYAGDNLIHSTIIKQGLKNNFNMYENVKDYINQFDIKAINQETVLINDEKQYSGYPTFGSPIGVGESIISTGFNLVTQATNHAYDKKEQGIEDSLKFWQENNIPVIGIHDNADDDIFIWETETMKIAMLNYTYGLNGFVLPEGEEYLVDDLYSDKVIRDLKYAEKEADITIVFPHWGVEYTHEETKEQERLAQLLADNGADIIIGCHPHVVEPLKKIISESGQEVPCFYSVGNFVSAQNEIPRMLGALAEVIIVNNNGNIEVKSAKMTPVVTHIASGYSGFNVYLLEDYTEEIASNHHLKNKGLSIEKLNNIWNEVTKNNTY